MRGRYLCQRMENTIEKTTGAGEIAAHMLGKILAKATLQQAYHWKASNGQSQRERAVADFLGVSNTRSALFLALEDAVEERFDQLIIEDNKNGWHKIG